MPKISPVKSPIAQHIKDCKIIPKGKSSLDAGRNLEFYTQIGEYIGNQTSRTRFKRLDNDTLEKRTVIKREIFEGFPKKIYEQYVVIESKIKQFLGKTEREDFLLPTEIKTTNAIIDKEKNILTKTVKERVLETPLKRGEKYGLSYYTMEGKPKYSTVTATTETQPYVFNPHHKYGIFE